jgi:hypothetical protein
LKYEWLNEWKTYITNGFANFLGTEGATLHWYSKQELIKKIEENDPQKNLVQIGSP